ncbi:hypothetical protein EKO27_g3476 [Xylaria grammica]|uniref:Uncharacterized protein n=1 Tax=Xylaria grammica TaxID=363999 RepID=A0A439DB33_9PEZI|nr:hypothetical protein EKO27_g3476 [Xylaria grammica]
MAGIPEESDDAHGGPVPYTPPQRLASPEPRGPHRRDDSDAFTNQLSPLPSSMSLSSLGSPLSPLRRRFSPSPSSPLYPQSEPDITQESRDVLVQRLNDLAAMLSQQQHVKSERMNALHAKVDELENALYTSDYSSKTNTRPARLPPRDPGGGDQDGSSLSWETPNPDDLLPSDMSSFASPTRPSQSTKARHIHGLLITRLERAAQHIIFLEEQIQGLERERKESDTELLNLQIQLKAIEVQCMSYVPQGADQELSESIGAWKREYSTLKQRRARNKEQLSSSNSTPTGRRWAPPPE